MSIGQIHTLPIVQMGHVEKIVEDIQNQPQAQQLLTQEIAAKNLQKANSQVQEVDPSVDAPRVDPDKKKEQKRQQQQKRRRRYAAEASSEQEQEETKGNNSGNPWAGIIVNTKV